MLDPRSLILSSYLCSNKLNIILAHVYLSYIYLRVHKVDCLLTFEILISFLVLCEQLGLFLVFIH